MNYIASIADFFKSPKWMMNLLLCGVCMMIPIVGPMALIGYHIGALFGSTDRIDFAAYPDFDFKFFGKYLERGLWPFLVNMAAAVVMVPIVWIVMAIPMTFMIALMSNQHGGHHAEPSPVVPLLFMVVVFVIIMVFAIVMTLVIKPLMLRAAITQDFAQAFNLKFLKDYLSRTWLETIIATVFLMVAAPFMALAGALVLCIGYVLGIALIMGAQWHMERQLYDLYLARGGQQVPISGKLSTTPPALPA